MVLLLASLYEKNSSEVQYYRVREVIDGDTISLVGLPQLVRYIGIDAPELPLSVSPGDPLGSEAKELNRALVEGKTVRLEYDEERYDPYGRLLAYVFADEVFANEFIVREGLAVVLSIPPNLKYDARLKRAEEEAQGERKGIWGDLRGLSPPALNRYFVVHPSRVRDHVGKRVVIRGKVTGFSRSKKASALKLEEGLDIVIFDSDLRRFAFFGINPQEFYVGKAVEVTGRVSLYKGDPRIIVSHPMSLRVID
ncbi:MAG: thermonuclease family protein [Candidatus Methanosuratincola sp.]